MQREYRAAIEAAKERQMRDCGFTYCARCGRNCDPGPHHYRGRIGRALLDFMLICWDPCHLWINGHQKEARKEGLIK